VPRLTWIQGRNWGVATVAFYRVFTNLEGSKRGKSGYRSLGDSINLNKKNEI